MSSPIDDLLERFQLNLDDISKVTSVIDEVIDITSGLVGSFHREATKYQINPLLGQKLTVLSDQIDRIKGHALIKQKLDKMNNQICVLYVGAFEAFLFDLIKLISNRYPEVIKENLKDTISFDTKLLRSGFTAGDAVVSHLKKEKVSFQSLENIKESLGKYLAIREYDLSDEVENVLCYSFASRHIIVHNGSKADPAFLNSVADIDRDFVEHDEISITESELGELKEAILELATFVVTEVNIRIEQVIA